MAQHFPSHFIPNKENLYLARYYVAPQVTHEEDRKSKTPLGLYLHFFQRSDADQELHNHPWDWALSFVLTGGYWEERRNVDDTVTRKLVSPFRFNFLRANTYHRVDLIDEEKGAWTLLLRGRRLQDWGFWNRNTKVFDAWQDFVSKKSKRNSV